MCKHLMLCALDFPCFLPGGFLFSRALACWGCGLLAGNVHMEGDMPSEVRLQSQIATRNRRFHAPGRFVSSGRFVGDGGDG